MNSIESEQMIDPEWADLIRQALDAGISPKEIRNFFDEHRNKETRICK